MIWGDTGKVAYGPLKTFTTTVATPRETLSGTPTALPLTEPATSQISFTVQASDLPVISPAPLSVKYTALLYASGQNTDAASQSVSWRVLKNGVSVATGTQTGVVASNYWTQGYYQFYDIAVGDVLEIRLWSTSANVNYNYYAISVYPTRMQVGKAYLNKDVSYSNFVSPLLTLGTPGSNNTSGFLIYPMQSVAGNSIMIISTNQTFGALHWSNSFNAGTVDRGDSTIQTSAQSSATTHPLYQRSYFPGTISFREVLR